MNKEDLKLQISNALKTTEKEISNKQKEIAAEQKFTREHNFNLENIGLQYKQELLSEVDFIFYNLCSAIDKIFEEDNN